ncbi:MAG: Gfo/Idh/MocA family oxidoreductase [Candidatus Komeilibacteria bacterium]|nr:Gfo/Idh/MocA family oxidoreductase [Candidatus Komeilibacteria bacterium]
MNKTSKILIIGFGSIGQRHYRNLTKLGYKNVFAYDVDKSKFKGQTIKILDQLTNDALNQFTAAFVCNPNNQHIQTALKCAAVGCHLFIEKPLSHNLAGISQLIKVCRKNKLTTMIGCNMRFHPCLKFIKNYLSQNKLGKVYGINHEFGYYLPYWRKGTDYRKNYAAKKSTGGGIILDDIHEFDLLFWLNDFSSVKQSNFIYSKVSDLQIETEDFCQAAFKFQNGVIGSVHCDYLQQSYSRTCKVIGERGNLEWSFAENIVWLKNQSGAKKLLTVKNFDFNQVYIDEVKYFFSCLDKKQSTFNEVKTAESVLKFCVKK